VKPQTSFGQVLDRMIERTLARIDDHAGERRIAEPAKLTKVKKIGRPKNPEKKALTVNPRRHIMSTDDETTVP
jgi:hypothetical protein